MRQDGERLLLFPSSASLSRDGSCWSMPVRAWVFRPEQDSRRRALLIRLLQKGAGIRSRGPEAATLDERMRPFLVDNCQGIRPWIKIGGEPYQLSPTDQGGHSATLIQIPPELSESVLMEAGLPGRAASAKSWGSLVPGEGLSIISDIDDTIKHSEVHDTRRLLRNTFTRAFEPVQGMADLYREWADQGAAFHYVSSSPWQLYSPLMEMLETARFPRGSMHLKRFRLKDRSIISILKDPRSTKPPIIQALLDEWPQRSFVLVGDSGELDPEIYGQIARDNPGRVQAIHIRTGPGADGSPDRFRKAFAGLPPECTAVFTDPREIQRKL